MTFNLKLSDLTFVTFSLKLLLTFVICDVQLKVIVVRTNFLEVQLKVIVVRINRDVQLKAIVYSPQRIRPNVSPLLHLTDVHFALINQTTERI